SGGAIASRSGPLLGLRTQGPPETLGPRRGDFAPAVGATRADVGYRVRRCPVGEHDRSLGDAGPLDGEYGTGGRGVSLRGTYRWCSGRGMGSVRSLPFFDGGNDHAENFVDRPGVLFRLGGNGSGGPSGSKCPAGRIGRGQA